jgi:hypothetical protein
MKRIVTRGLALVLLFDCAVLAATTAPAAALDSGCRIGAGAEPATICISSGSDVVRLMAGRLADFLELRTGARPGIVDKPTESIRGAVFLLARASQPAVRALTTQPSAKLPEMDGYRDDGYAIRTTARGPATYILCAGKGDSGIKYAVYRLMRATSTRDRVVTVPPLRLESTPFFKGRYATPSSAMAGGAPPLLQKHYAWENWDVSRVPALADFFDAAGMNGVFLFDSPCRYDWTGNHTSPDQMAIKIRALAGRARELGMSVCLWVHGTSNLQARSFSELQPRDPKQYEQILRDYDRLAERYGDVIDAVYGHWVDPGGAPPPADITDPQKLQMEIYKRLEKKAGRPILNIFSAHGLHWPMGPGGTLPWAGYQGAETLISGGILPKGTCIASPEMRIYPDEIEFARKVRAAGYTCGLFGWLVAEYEMNPAIHVHTHIMDRYFHGIPEESKELFDWYEEGLVYTTMNLATYYVFAQMLWDPRSSADEHLADFCGAAFGPELGPRMLKGLRAVADVRCGDAGPEDRGGCRLGRGSADPARDLKICEEALAELDGAYADYSYLPVLPLPVPIETQINDLRAQLNGMATYARFRVASGRVGAIIAKGGSEQQIREAMAALPRMEVWPGTSQPKTPGSWGQPEYWPYIDVINRWEQQLQAMAGGGVPEAKGPVLFADDFARYPAGADGRPHWHPTTDAAEGAARPQWMTERGTMSVSIPGPGGELASATGLLMAGGADWNVTKDWKNYTVQVRVKLIREAPIGGSAGLRVRIVGADAPGSQSGYYLRLSGKVLEFGWLANGSSKPLQTVPVVIEAGTWHTLRVDCLDYIYKAYLDGRLLLGADDWYGHRKGRVALEIRNVQAAFSDFSVRQIE